LNPIAKVLGIPLAIEYTVESIVERIKNGSIKRVAVMAGAGLSVSAGIPDFRSPGAGIYSKLQEFNLPYPEALFDLSFFKKNPKVFYTVMQSMAKKYYPTKGHYFIRLLQDKGILLKVYTQNIDGLEIEAGVKQENCLQAHGTIATSHCVSCSAQVSSDLMTEHIVKGEPLYCPKCKGPCKPDVVLFGESLPTSFFTQFGSITQADLVIVIGTTLKVTPFANLINSVGSRVPRLIVDKALSSKISAQSDQRNVVMLGEADATLEKLAGMLGWEAEFNALLKEREALINKYEEDKAKGIAKPF
jgi:NAD-dependent SIR2 family protein deacetylase